jgi:hypothetical protein
MKQLQATTQTTAAPVTTAERGINGFVLNTPSTFLVISMVPAKAYLVNSLAFVTQTVKQGLLSYKPRA